jgi:hypothetical protein
VSFQPVSHQTGQRVAAKPTEISKNVKNEKSNRREISWQSVKKADAEQEERSRAHAAPVTSTKT